MTTNTFTVFSDERRALIAKIKLYIKEGAFKGSGIGHADYVLYAALRGQDIRKTSHLPDGANARDQLDRLLSIKAIKNPSIESDSDRTRGGFLLLYTKTMMPEKEFLITTQDLAIIRDALNEAKERLEAPMKQAS